MDFYITIKIKEQRTASVSVGGGLDTVTGLFGSLGITENNFRGRTERISEASWKLSYITNELCT